MTHKQARAAGLPPGWAVRNLDDLETYASGVPECPVTQQSEDAEHFMARSAAESAAGILRRFTGGSWTAWYLGIREEDALHNAMAAAFEVDEAVSNVAYPAGRFRLASE